MTGWTLVLAFTVAAVAAVRGLWSPCGLSMVSALNPMSERARGHRYPLTALWYVAGAVAGGAVLGAGCALGASAVGRLPLTADGTALLVLGCAVIAFVSDVPALSWHLPGHPRQVNEQWIGRYRRWIYAAGFGAQIGAKLRNLICKNAKQSRISVLCAKRTIPLNLCFRAHSLYEPVNSDERGIGGVESRNIAGRVALRLPLRLRIGLPETPVQKCGERLIGKGIIQFVENGIDLFKEIAGG